MKAKEYLKRFCFGIANTEGVGNQICFALKKGGLRNFVPDLEIENLELFKHGPFYFIILDVRSKLEVSRLKKRVIEYLKTSREITRLDYIFLLDRIFKKEPSDDHLVPKIEAFKRTVMTLELENDPVLLKEYKEIHGEGKVWPQILANMDTVGIEDMEIYLLGYQAFLIMDAKPKYDMEKDGLRWANLPREKEWQKYVAKFQKVDPNNKALEKWKIMTLIQ